MTKKGVTPAIGIRLGITLSGLGVWHLDKVMIIKCEEFYSSLPSVVAFMPTQCLIGQAASDQFLTNKANTINGSQRLVGRRFNDPEVQQYIKHRNLKVIKGSYGLPKVVVEYKGKEKEYSAEEISSMVVVQLKNLAESHLGVTIKDAVITVPAYFNESQRQATKVVAHLAGLDVLQIIDEPVAAAIAYGLHKKTADTNVLVFNLDYETFEVSIVNVDESGKITLKATGGDIHFGGEYINESCFSKCIKILESFLRDAKINKTDVEDIILVGGMALIPEVQQLLQEFFNGKQLDKSIDTIEVVAHGAAIHAADLKREKIEKEKTLPTLPLLDIVPLSLGVDAHDGVFSVIIPRNTPIPAEKEQIYFTTVDNQISIPFNVYQGERSRAKDNKWLGKFEVVVSSAPKGKSKVKVVFGVDADGTFNCWVKEFTTGLKRKIIIDNDNRKVSKEEVTKMLKDAEKYKLEDREYKKIMRLRNVLEEYIYNVKRKMKTIGSTDKTRLHAEEIKKMENAIEDANQYVDGNHELADVDEYQNVIDQLEKLCVGVIAQLV